MERLVQIGNGAEIDDNDVLVAITIQDVLVLLSSGEHFPVFTSNKPTEIPQQGRHIYMSTCMYVCMYVCVWDKFNNETKMVVCMNLDFDICHFCFRRRHQLC